MTSEFILCMSTSSKNLHSEELFTKETMVLNLPADFSDFLRTLKNYDNKKYFSVLQFAFIVIIVLFSRTLFTAFTFSQGWEV